MYSEEFKSICHQLLKDGLAQFGLSLGIVSHVVHDVYEVVLAYSDPKIIEDGTSFDLEDTYCREVITCGATVAITEYEGEPGMSCHPLYDNMPIEAYISAPLFLDGEVWGTLNFSSGDIRNKHFSDEDIQWIEEAAAEISKSLPELTA